MTTAPFHPFAQGTIGSASMSDVFKVALIGNTSPATTARFTSQTVADLFTTVSPTEASTTGTGYTAGGLTLTLSQTVYSGNASAGSLWSTTWAAATVYNIGDIVRPATANGVLFQCVAPGTSAASQPTFPTTQGLSVTETAGPTWLCIGSSATVLTTATTIVWTTTTGTLSAFYGILYDTSVGAGGFAGGSTNPLLGFWDLSNAGAGLTATGGGTFAISVPVSGLIARGSW